jgi:D-glycero-D-manno-heptose 1,7-bisphosphate phosphatase
MIKEIGKRFSLELNQVFAVGDALRDLQAFADAGCLPILVRTGKGEATLEQGNLPANTLVFADLNEAVQYIIAQSE